MSSDRIAVSAVVITHNEEANLPACLASLRFCQEIVVIDSGSTDRTCQIARELADKVVTLPWSGFAAQKNKAIEYAAHSWVLSVDADERVPSSLEQEIRALFTGGAPMEPGAFSIPRKTIHFGRWIRYGGWYPNRLVRFFRKEQGRWEGEELHESWVSKQTVGALASDLEHYSFKDLADQVDRNNRYSTLGALKLQRTGVRFSLVRLFAKPLSKFLESYLVKRGFLDGYPGLIISVSAAYSVFLKWAKLWELENGQKKTR